ncbi:hypothetical protein THF5H11_40312 [Vibrio jasicida]|nr:hypothetical protein THF5H11_40312 [Vibrio jasicida]
MRIGILVFESNDTLSIIRLNVTKHNVVLISNIKSLLTSILTV